MGKKPSSITVRLSRNYYFEFEKFSEKHPHFIAWSSFLTFFGVCFSLSLLIKGLRTGNIYCAICGLPFLTALGTGCAIVLVYAVKAVGDGVKNFIKTESDLKNETDPDYLRAMREVEDMENECG